MRRALTILTAVAVAVAVAACGTTSGATGGEPGASTLPRFTATTLDGGTFALGDHLGKDVVMLSFWATYCEPCKAEMPVLEQLHAKYAAQGLQILSVSLDGADTVSGVRPHIKKNGYTFDVVVDDDGTIAQAYNPAGVAPFMVLIGKDGRIAKRIEGFQASEAASLEREVQALLGLPE
ncbi:MAG: TlpA family protein disulfide reductase [Deltaproteobacteria bacterium HGW-Deltaproteobacteria-14]|jgi:peroxiredoxin|nr:MAG: TlpA family protein disulfide reductase [Deltaproteobacteria bacterium HGW-Deltaproteobacteria-14]